MNNENVKFNMDLIGALPQNKIVEQAKDALSRRGYYTGNIWHIEDVQKDFYCDDFEADEILSDVFSKQSVIDAICNAIEYECNFRGLERRPKRNV
jgi:hypothetical protein